MPHSVASRKQVLDLAAEKFHRDLQHRLKDDQKNMQRFYNAVKKLRRESAAPETVVAKINACMRKYPEFCNRVVGFHPDGSIRLKETEPALRMMLIPDTPPARFTNDALMSIVVWLPFPSLGRLAQSCKWMSAHITQEQVEGALKRARERFGKVELVTDLSTGKQVLRLFSTNEEMVEMWRLNQDSSIYVIRACGKTFLGISSYTSYTSNFRADGETVIFYMSEMFRHAISTLETSGPDTPVVWIKDVMINHPSKNTLRCLFWVINGDNIRAAHCAMHFEELVL